VPVGILVEAERDKTAFPSPAGVIRELTPAGKPVAVNPTFGGGPPLNGTAVRLIEDEPPAWRCMAEVELVRAKSPPLASVLN